MLYRSACILRRFDIHISYMLFNFASAAFGLQRLFFSAFFFGLFLNTSVILLVYQDQIEIYYACHNTICFIYV